ncbi:MAG: two-component system response regulator [Deltaproteobacteria bacterium]|nr:MAG: two-component system response regulator [Deltaproteobacteria bacterium]
MKTILIVDDSAFTRGIHSRLIKALGHQTIEAESGAEAIERFKAKQPDLVMMDLLMPDMDGLDAIRKILAIDTRAKTIVCSTDKQKARQEEAREAGVLAFLIKPVDGDQLKSTLSELFEE